MAAFLKDLLQPGMSLEMAFQSRSELQKGVSKTTGDPYEYYDYEFLLNGKPHKERIFTTNVQFGSDKVLAKANPGDTCQVTKNAKGYLVWQVMPRGEDYLQESHPSTTQQIRVGTKVNGASDEERVKSIAISLQGYTQVIIAAMVRAKGGAAITINEQEVMDAVDLAANVRNVVLKKAQELAS